LDAGKDVMVFGRYVATIGCYPRKKRKTLAKHLPKGSCSPRAELITAVPMGTFLKSFDTPSIVVVAIPLFRCRLMPPALHARD
jgi:hypothetical protein